MEGSDYENLNSIICRKGAIHTTEIERPLLAANGFNTNLVHFLPPHHSFACTKSRVRKIIIYEGLLLVLPFFRWYYFSFPTEIIM